MQQQVNTITGASATGTTLTPYDDTIPQNTEGTEFVTLSITPQRATDVLVIDAIMIVTTSNSAWMIVSLFQDTTANALATVATFITTATSGATIPIRHRMVAGTTSSTTFKIRIGPHQASTITFNGQGGNRKMGGVFASSFTITELLP